MYLTEVMVSTTALGMSGEDVITLLSIPYSRNVRARCPGPISKHPSFRNSRIFEQCNLQRQNFDPFDLCFHRSASLMQKLIVYCR